MRKIAVAILCFAVSGCSVMNLFRGKDEEVKPLEPMPVPSIDKAVSVERLWRHDVGGDNTTGLRPALEAGVVYVASLEGRVAAVDLESGSTVWRSEHDISISGGVGTGEGLVLVGGLDGEVLALDSRDGVVVWQTRVGSEVIAPPRADAGAVLVRTVDGGVSGLAADSGEQLWTMRRSIPSLTLRGGGAPIVNQGVAIMGFDDGALAAINMENGALAWEIPVARPSGTNEVARMVDVDATPVVRGSVLYAAAFQGAVTAYDLRSNQQVWSREASTHRNFSVDGRRLYLADADGRIHAMDRRSGDAVWVNEQLLRRRLSGPAVAGDYVVVGDFEGYLHVLDKADGRLVGRRELDSRIPTQPLVQGERILVLSNEGRLHALSITPGGD